MSFFLILLALCVSSAWTLRAAPPYALEDAELHFETFIKRHDKQYADEDEKQARFEIFKVNLEEINRLNEGQDAAIFGLTQFMDLTHEEFLRGYTGFLQNSTDYFQACPNGSEEEIQKVVAPESFDWRQQNAVTPVKNQMNCGSCYAFSAVGNIESQYAIRTGQQVDLSEQQMVDCDTESNACHGGYPQNVFRYLIAAGGAEGESDYPYRDTVTGPCQFDSSRVRVRLSSCRAFSLSSQESLKQLLYSNGPVSIAIQSDGIKGFDGGYIPDDICNVGIVNHAVLLVGYGTHSSGTPIWIVKNSWGTGWGNQGYFNMVRGENAHSCGMMNDHISTAIVG